ncbi:Multidrug resistance protein 3 [Planctomycetes bacterium Pla163]|uniref:Multidrug resistance protein 3 n=1 Tax=Rohdeia mirabilis TaxID=2528008 RepID=A0A518D385_9BACT|nr:Multidrug resistance protein 3 [Planctomycetes bacterium Pla163]
MSTWKRTWWSVWIANLLTGVGMMSFLPYFPSYLEGLGVSDPGEVKVWAGLCFGAAPFSAAIMGPVWGAVGDRFGRKKMVLRSLLALTFFVGLMAFARTPWELLALRIGQGLFSGILPPSITLVSIGVPDSRRGRVAGWLQSAMAAGAIFGPLLGSWVRADSDPRYLFLGVSVATGLGALGVAVFATEDATERREKVEGVGVLQALVRDLVGVLRIPQLRAAMALLFCVQFGIGATNPVLELYVRDLMPGVAQDVTSARAGWLFSVMSAMLVASSPVWGPLGDRIGHARALMLSAVVAVVALFGMGLADGFWFLLGARVLLGIGAGGLGPTAFGLAAQSVPAHARGAANGAVFSARAFALATSSMAGGFIASLIGIRSLFLVAGAVLGLALVVGAARLRRG